MIDGVTRMPNEKPESERQPESEAPADRGEGKIAPRTPGKAEGEVKPDSSDAKDPSSD